MNVDILQVKPLKIPPKAKKERASMRLFVLIALI